MIESIKLPDPGDRHIVAAAISIQADVIVIANLKDFPPDYLALFNIEVQHPDEFISHLIDLNPQKANEAFARQVSMLKNPPKTKEDVLGYLKKCGLMKSAELLKSGIWQ